MTLRFQMTGGVIEFRARTLVNLTCPARSFLVNLCVFNG
jgi:hypothetical protein